MTKTVSAKTQVILASTLAIGLLGATPASAAGFNCFEWVRVSTAHLMHPHHHHHAHPAIGVPHRHLVHVHVVPHVHRIATPFVRRPIACPEHEAMLASPFPGAAPPETLAMLEHALAGPAPAVTEAAQDVAAVTPASEEILVPSSPEIGFPFGLPGDFDTPPVELFPGPVTGFPVSPPVTPPDVFVPPVTPPEVIVPVVTPPLGPPGGPPIIPPPVVGPGPGPLGGVPEPAAWSLMLLGFAAVGAALRRRRRAPRARALECGEARAQS